MSRRSVQFPALHARVSARRGLSRVSQVQSGRFALDPGTLGQGETHLLRVGARLPDIYAVALEHLAPDPVNHPPSHRIEVVPGTGSFVGGNDVGDAGSLPPVVARSVRMAPASR